MLKWTKKWKHIHEGEAALSEAEVWLLCLPSFYTEPLKKETSKPVKPLNRHVNVGLQKKDVKKIFLLKKNNNILSITLDILILSLNITFS